MQSLRSMLEELETRIPDHQKSNTAVSAGNVGWHIEHSALVLIKIGAELERSDITAYQWKFNWKKSYVFLLNRIPRGRAIAPKSVTPREIITEAGLRSLIAEAGEKLRMLDSLQNKHHFTHPFFGKLKRSEALKFIGLHTRHHLKIIRDILL